jgi:hypothetical protein
MARSPSKTTLLLEDTAGVKERIRSRKMKMVSTPPSSNSWKRINSQLAAFAGGLALATVAIIGGGEILRDGGNTERTSSLPRTESRAVGLGMNEPDFGSLVIGPVGLVMDEPDFGSVTADRLAFAHSVTTSPGSTEVARTPIVDPHFGTGAESVSALEGDE